MLRKLLGTGLLLATLAGCTKLGGKTCSADADCASEGGLCDTSVGLCYFEPEVETCTPACAAYEACTTGGCRQRFTELKILTPANNTAVSGATVELSVQLVANPSYASTQHPETLNFTATRSDGGSDVGSFGSVTRTGDTYTVSWTAPAAQAQFTLTAAHPLPGAVPSASVTVLVDKVGPTFNIAFSSPPTRAPGSPSQADPRDQDSSFAEAFRRDESVTVTVSANEAVSNVMLTVRGIASGGGPGAALAPVAVQPGGTCVGSPPFCGTATVDLFVPEMNAFRGTMQFQVNGTDAAGNPGTASEGLKVTRWRWAFDAGGAISGTPAIGARGFVFVGTHVTTQTGKMVAVGPDGARKWETPVGDVSGPPAVGALTANNENVYVAARSTTGPALYALRGSDGVEKYKCSYSNATEVPGALAVTVTTVTVGTAETGTGVYSGSPVRIVGIRPDASVTVDRCFEISGTGGGAIPASIAGSSLVVQEQNIFYAITGPRITSYDVAAGLNAPRAGWPQSTPSFARGLALGGGAQPQLYAAAANSDDPSLGSLLKFATTGGASTFVYPQANTSRVFNLAIGSGNTAYFGAETASSAELLSLALDTAGASPTRAMDVGTLRGAPVLGRNGRLYTLNTDGQLAAWTASALSQIWSVDLILDPSTRESSPTLDCRRDDTGNPVVGSSLGALYFVAGSKLYSFIVDSPGLDPNAAWPKYQHDARNTGNPATPITNCP
jgi:hypothetical protein